MANIEKKRLEKLEAEKAEYKKEFTPPATAPAPAPEPPVEAKTETPPPPAPVVVPPTPPPKPKVKRESTIVNPVIDEEKIASRVAEEVLRKIDENKPKRKPRTTRPRPVAVPDDEPKIVHNFSWL